MSSSFDVSTRDLRPKRTIEGVDALRAAVGQHLGHSDWHRVTQEMVDAFADVTGDHQWIHVDRERAATGPFGGTIAHGFLTLSLAPVLVFEVLEVTGMAMSVNYGMDRVRFPAPVPVGARVRAGVELTALDDVAGGVQITLRATIEREGAEKPVCVADLLSRFYV
jgi:acyl dehydratase